MVLIFRRCWSRHLYRTPFCSRISIRIFPTNAIESTSMVVESIYRVRWPCQCSIKHCEPAGHWPIAMFSHQMISPFHRSIQLSLSKQFSTGIETRKPGWLSLETDKRESSTWSVCSQVTLEITRSHPNDSILKHSIKRVCRPRSTFATYPRWGLRDHRTIIRHPTDPSTIEQVHSMA